MVSTVKSQCVSEACSIPHFVGWWHMSVLYLIGFPGLSSSPRSEILPDGTFPKPWQSRASDAAFDAKISRLQ